MRYFTVKEAEALIPELEKIFEALIETNAKTEAKNSQIQEMKVNKSKDAAGLAIETSQLEFLINSMNGWLNKILDTGALPKGLDPALVDFPYRLKDREVYLCWKLGDKKITHYHGLEDGFAGRKPLAVAGRGK